jgi:hypothetical protein
VCLGTCVFLEVHLVVCQVLPSERAASLICSTLHVCRPRRSARTPKTTVSVPLIMKKANRGRSPHGVRRGPRSAFFFMLLCHRIIFGPRGSTAPLCFCLPESLPSAPPPNRYLCCHVCSQASVAGERSCESLPRARSLPCFGQRLCPRPSAWLWHSRASQPSPLLSFHELPAQGSRVPAYWGIGNICITFF